MFLASYAIIAIPSCPSKIEGLVHYPTTLAPVSGSRFVEAQCADNAHSVNSSLNVTCVSDGSWSGTIPHCECDLEYYRATINGKQICLGEMPVCVTYFIPLFISCKAIPPTLCEATSEGLVRYPNWLAPLIGSVTVATECADNAHLTSSSLNVTCASNGSWWGQIPVCKCDVGHHVSTTDDGRQICQG